MEADVDAKSGAENDADAPNDAGGSVPTETMRDSFLTFVRMRLRALWSPRRLGLFVGVGTVGATVDTVVLFLLVSFTVLGPVGGKIGAWIVAISVIFAINERWTFAQYGLGEPRAVLRRLGRSYAVRFAGFLVSLAVLFVLVYGFGVWFVAANVLAIAAGFFVNYTAESLYTWKVHLE